MSALLSDLRAAINALGSARAFSAISLVTLSTGIALATVLLAVVNAYLVRGLPYPDADRLYRVDYAPPGERWPEGMEQLEWSSLSDLIEHSISWDLDVFYLLGGDYPESSPGAWVTPGYVHALGIRTAMGRALTEKDFRPDSPAVALISHRLWQTRFGGDPAVIGDTFNAYVSDRPEEPETFTVVGVLPSSLWHLNVYTEILTPLKAPSFPYQVRLRSGSRRESARERIDSLVRNGIASLPPAYGVTLTSVHESYVNELRPMLWSVAAGSGLVLLIAIANVSVLMLVRTRRRDREVALRLALGASHWRVGRLVALEGLSIGVGSTVVGISTAIATLPLLAPAIERSLERRVPGGLSALTIDGNVAGLALASGALLSALLMSIPLVMLWRSRPEVSVAGAGRGTTEGTHATQSRAVLIGIEVAASLTLVVGAWLMAESALRMTRVDFGIEAENVVTAGLAVRQRSFPTESDRALLYERLERELQSIAGPSAVAFGDWWPLQGSRPQRVETGETFAAANRFAVSSHYFAVMGIQLRDGRVFTRDDRYGTEPVVIVSASLAARVWPHTRAVGQSLTVHADGEEPAHTATVTGVVSDTRQSHTDTDQLDFYLPLTQRASRFAFVYLRRPQGAAWERELRTAIARVNPEVAMGTPRLLDAGIEQERARPRLLAYLLTTFAVFASVLALIGMYGVIAYAVRQRRREIAVRIALGADSQAVTFMFLRHGIIVLSAGLFGGLIGAIGLGRVLQSQLYGVASADPHVLVGAALAFAVSAIAAVLWPARRAASVDPVELLKQE
jgi:predicted permease